MQLYPSVSVIIPSWNQGKFIERTLLSILKQDYPGRVEIIVSDGASTDGTIAVLKKYADKIIWWSAPDEGYVDAVTKGLARASGEILAIQSSDDYYLPGAFRCMAGAFQQYPDAGFISGGEYAIDLTGNIRSRSALEGKITPHIILFESIPPQHATFIKRPFMEEVGGLRREVDMCADIDLWYRVAHLAPGYFIPSGLAVYQLHPDQRTVTSDKWYSNLVKMVELCEQEARYGQKFKLSNAQKRDLFAYWEINWASIRGGPSARSIALAKLPQFYTYSPRTRRMILGTTINPILKKVVPAKIIQMFRPEAPTTSAQPYLEWWNA